MPALGLLILGAQVLCAIHVVRAGRPYWWIFLIVMVPAVGVIVYLAVELLPGLLGSRGARQAVSGAAKIFDPGRGLREARRQVAPVLLGCVPYKIATGLTMAATRFLATDVAGFSRLMGRTRLARSRPFASIALWWSNMVGGSPRQPATGS